ncbi:tetratricopeptide repeat protein [Moraxellaceae bacterium AER2_44_116]|nr:tetratricopeptide repeat protein [Moraxellaceae bacterium]TQC99987.1 tetratricopeptide repeat protein [Moraxellaceae bacterium AER2_44_116]
MNVVCGKCSHVRSDSEQAPDWQCPACGVAYVKVQKESSEQEGVVEDGHKQIKDAIISFKVKTTLFFLMLLILVVAVSNNNTRKWPELHSKSRVLFEQGSYAAAIDMEKKALVIAHNDENDDDRVARSLYSLAHFSRKSGQFVEAEAFYKQAIFLWNKTKSSDMEIVLGDLAQMYMEQGRFSEAEPLLMRYLHVTEKRGDQGEIVLRLEALAIIYKETGRIYQYKTTVTRVKKIRGG